MLSCGVCFQEYRPAYRADPASTSSTSTITTTSSFAAPPPSLDVQRPDRRPALSASCEHTVCRACVHDLWVKLSNPQGACPFCRAPAAFPQDQPPPNRLHLHLLRGHLRARRPPQPRPNQDGEENNQEVPAATSAPQSTETKDAAVQVNLMLDDSSVAGQRRPLAVDALPPTRTAAPPRDRITDPTSLADRRHDDPAPCPLLWPLAGLGYRPENDDAVAASTPAAATPAVSTHSAAATLEAADTPAPSTAAATQTTPADPRGSANTSVQPQPPTPETAPLPPSSSTSASASLASNVVAFHPGLPPPRIPKGRGRRSVVGNKASNGRRNSNPARAFPAGAPHFAPPPPPHFAAGTIGNVPNNPNELFRLLSEKRWDDAQTHAAANPDQVAHRFEGHGRYVTALHAAIFFGAPAGLVQILVDLYPPALSVRAYYMGIDDQFWIPRDWAIKLGRFDLREVLPRPAKASSPPPSSSASSPTNDDLEPVPVRSEGIVSEPVATERPSPPNTDPLAPPLPSPDRTTNEEEAAAAPPALPVAPLPTRTLEGTVAAVTPTTTQPPTPHSEHENAPGSHDAPRNDAASAPAPSLPVVTSTTQSNPSGTRDSGPHPNLSAAMTRLRLDGSDHRLAPTPSPRPAPAGVESAAFPAPLAAPVLP